MQHTYAPLYDISALVILKEIVETLLPLSKEIVKSPHDRSLYSSKAASCTFDRGFSLFLIFLKSIQMSLNSFSNQYKCLFRTDLFKSDFCVS